MVGSRFATNSALTSHPEVKAAIAEEHPDGGKVRFLTFTPARMLQDARTTGLVKLRCGDGTTGE
ncbi:hypothetical protein [Aquicoccus sp. SU-CL01552]|uniref:hypothetical protein n=1 Tax=Aquicoccus sp. SU-CL01552 TaxID=3127656 RepID=UPI0031041D55